MKKTLIAVLIASVFTTGLTGCGKSDKELKMEADAAAYQQAQAEAVKQQQLELEAQQAASAQQAQDTQELADVVAELKKGDPLVKDAYYGYNEKGDRVLHVIRDNPPQQQPQTGYGQPQYQNASGQPVIINNQPAQQASSGVSESIWPLAAGVGAGMLLAHAMNSGGGYNSYSSYHQPYSSRNWNSDNDYRRERTTVVNNYHTTTINNTRTAYRNPNGPVAQKMAAQGFQPVKQAPAAPGFAQTKQLASPTTLAKPVQPAQQPVAKPLTNPQVNSYWSQPKPEPVKPAAPSNSYWGSTAKASPSPAAAKTTGYSSGSSYKPSASPARTFTASPARRR
jgi:hypothetical protein